MLRVVLTGLCGVLGGVLLVLVATRATPIAVLLAICGLPAIAMIFLNPVFGFLVTMAVIPMERLGRLTNDANMYTFSVMRVVGLLALASFLFHAFLRKRPLYFSPAFFLYLAYFGFSGLTIAYTSDVVGTVRACSAILGNLTFFFLVVNVVHNWRLAKVGVLIWLGASVAAGLYTVYDWHAGQRHMDESRIGMTEERLSTVWSDTSEWESLEQVPRAMGPTSHAAVYGINMILTLPFFVYLLRTQATRLAKIAIGLSLMLIFYNILLTNTRAAIVLACCVIGFCLLRKLLIVTPAEVVAFLLLSVLMLPFVPAAIYTRVLDMTNYTYKQSGTFRIRTNYWYAGLKVIEENWLRGVGVGNQNVIPKYIKGEGPAQTTIHNEYLQTFLEVGVIGGLCFFGFVGLILWWSYKAASVLRTWRDTQEQYWFMVACQIAMVAVLLYGVQVDVFHFPLKGWWLIASLSCVMYQWTKQLTTPAARVVLEEVRTG